MSDSNWHHHLQQMIRDYQIHTVRMSLNDNSNIARARYIPAQKFLEIGTRGNVSFPSVLFSMDTSEGVQTRVGTGFQGGFPSWEIKPDYSTFSPLPYKPGIARLIGDLYGVDGKPIETSPRFVLQQVLQEYKNGGYLVYGAFEYEFYVYKETENGLEPSWKGLHCFSETKQSQVEDIFISLFKNLSEMGAGPEVANTEYGSGQFEVTHSPFWDLEIADMAFYYRTSIKEILHDQGYKTTFMSKPVKDMSGSGAHLNLSIHDEKSVNLFSNPNAPDGLSDLCRWFIGGQQLHVRALSALVNPTINSYKRLQPYSFAPTTNTWGYEHRGTMIRIPRQRGRDTRIEHRLPGADTNPYLSLAAILAAGLDGIRKKQEPTLPLQNQDAYQSDFEKLPRSLYEALSHLKEDTFFKEMLGEAFINDYVELRQAEWDRYLAHVTDWELQEYLNIF
ncbi:glutamine synthetase family protein [Heyndrickxia acidicola]|uniref:glutamine synthetase n=1 Tax=Heyndrickxia acidicola TaxID=209389 RepID=A0ABU6ML15_9BACI|nr:glutamine synthetase family protein [Heyndrickxia acidicola]MED1203927.1 glutamine synthetase family protein [Heyndrickxia acidicola]